MKRRGWQNLSNGAAITAPEWDGKRMSGWGGSFACLNGQPGLRKFICLVQYESTPGLQALEMVTARRSWLARQNGLRIIRRALAAAAEGGEQDG